MGVPPKDSIRESFVETPYTYAPRALAIWTAAVPTDPDAP